MPQFVPGESKTALAPIVVKPSGLSCSTELYLVSNGAKVATSGVKAFTSTGAKQDIRFPLTMPAEGAYPVYLDIFTNGLPIGAYQAREDVVIVIPVEEIYFRVIASFPPSVRWQWGVAPWQYIIKMYVYTCSPADGGGFFSPVFKTGVAGLSTPVGAEVGTQLPVYYSAGTLEARILPEHIKEEFAIPVEYEPGHYYYLCPSRISGELKVKIYEIWLDEGGGLASKKFIAGVIIPTVVYPDARINIDLTPYCPALE